MSTPPPRPRRDALRNRALVLDAARTVFSARGLETTLEDVAVQSGLGVGTVHRAFGSKAGLVTALFEARLDEVVALVDDCASAQTGWTALRRVLWALTELQIRDRALQHLLYEAAGEGARLLRSRLEPRLTAMIDRAKSEGRVRPDLAATDIAVFSRAVGGSGTDSSPLTLDLARRHIELLIKGIAATPDDGPIPAPLEDDAFQGWLAGPDSRPGSAP